MRHIGQLERLRGGHDAFVAEVEGVGHGRLGAHRDDGFFVTDKFLACVGLDAQSLRIFEVAAAMHDFDVAMLRQSFNSLAEFFDDRFFPRAQLVQIKIERAEFDAAFGRLLRLAHDRSSMQQCLGRNAADVHTDAAEPGILFDESYFFALVSGVKRGGVTAGAGAENEDFSAGRFHRLRFYLSFKSASSNASSPAITSFKKRTASAPSRTR